MIVPFSEAEPQAPARTADETSTLMAAATQHDLGRLVETGLSSPSSTQVAGGSDEVWRSIYQQESSSGRDTRTSSTGAVGPGQIMPATFREWARPGEDIANPEHNVAVSKRMVEAYHQRYGGDPARVAVAYFSGPGNVAPAGSPTPWKRNTSDGSTTVSEYVSKVTGRLGTPGAMRRSENVESAGGGGTRARTRPAGPAFNPADAESPLAKSAGVEDVIPAMKAINLKIWEQDRDQMVDHFEKLKGTLVGTDMQGDIGDLMTKALRRHEAKRPR